jgi:hypothetical protein
MVSYGFCLALHTDTNPDLVQQSQCVPINQKDLAFDYDFEGYGYALFTLDGVNVDSNALVFNLYLQPKTTSPRTGVVSSGNILVGQVAIPANHLQYQEPKRSPRRNSVCFDRISPRDNVSKSTTLSTTVAFKDDVANLLFTYNGVRYFDPTLGETMNQLVIYRAHLVINDFQCIYDAIRVENHKVVCRAQIADHVNVYLGRPQQIFTDSETNTRMYVWMAGDVFGGATPRSGSMIDHEQLVEECNDQRIINHSTEMKWMPYVPDNDSTRNPKMRLPSKLEEDQVLALSFYNFYTMPPHSIDLQLHWRDFNSAFRRNEILSPRSLPAPKVKRRFSKRAVETPRPVICGVERQIAIDLSVVVQFEMLPGAPELALQKVTLCAKNYKESLRI